MVSYEFSEKMKTPRTFVIGIYTKNGKMFVANTQEEIEKEYAQFLHDFVFMKVIKIEDIKLYKENEKA